MYTVHRYALQYIDDILKKVLRNSLAYYLFIESCSFIKNNESSTFIRIYPLMKCYTAFKACYTAD